MTLINSIKYSSSWDGNKSTGKDWFYEFLKRNLSLSTPKRCNLSRGTSSTKANVEMFLDNLQELNKDPHFADGVRVLSLDERDICTVQKPRKIIAEKSQAG